MKELIARLVLFTCLLGLLVGCNDTLVETIEVDEPQNGLPSTLKIKLDGKESKGSRLAYQELGTPGALYLKNTWEQGDEVSVGFLGNSSYYAIYTLQNGEGTSNGIFGLTNNNWNSTNTNYYGIYYPSSLRSDLDFFGFSYQNQTQTGDGNMNHLKSFHTIRAIEGYGASQSFSGEIDFTADNVLQSSCMKFVLQDFPVMTPTKITLVKVDANGFISPDFYTTNAPEGTYASNAPSPQMSNKLELNLASFPNTTSVTAYMMMSCGKISLYSGEKFRIYIENGTQKYYADKSISSNTVLEGGKLHVLTVSGQNAWTLDSTPASSSQDYQTYDGNVTIVSATESKSTDLIIMGDGFIGEDFQNNTYINALEQACDDFFSVEPLKSLRSYFNVYYVNAVSDNRLQIDKLTNGASATTPVMTKFGSYFVSGETKVGGNDGLVMEYAKKALEGQTNADERIKSAQIIVVVNADCHAGTCYSSYNVNSTKDYGEYHSIAYCSMNSDSEARRLTLVHEAAGHGFGKLLDEYQGGYYDNVKAVWNNVVIFHHIGHGKNVDKYVTEDKIDATYTELTTVGNVYWSSLIEGDNYESEGLGIYEGAYLSDKDFCRPTYNSVMRNQFDPTVPDEDTVNNYYRFNPISRWAIWYRFEMLTGASYVDFAASKDDFISFDEQHQDSQPVSVYSRGVLAPQDYKPLPPPVLIKGRWENGRFIEEK